MIKTNIYRYKKYSIHEKNIWYVGTKIRDVMLNVTENQSSTPRPQHEIHPMYIYTTTVNIVISILACDIHNTQNTQYALVCHTTKLDKCSYCGELKSRAQNRKHNVKYHERTKANRIQSMLHTQNSAPTRERPKKIWTIKNARGTRGK